MRGRRTFDRWVSGEELVDDGVPVEPGEGVELAGDGGELASGGLEFAGEDLDLGAGGAERVDAPLCAPTEPLSQRDRVGGPGLSLPVAREKGECVVLGSAATELIRANDDRTSSDDHPRSRTSLNEQHTSLIGH